ncbi:MAG TPA: transporter [Jiangellaceae bacterium]|nr:transporter [Jiangellaceae bacterium]
MSRALAVVMLALALAGIYLMMWRGWRRRARSQGGLPALPGPIPDAEALVDPVEAVYLGTTSAGDWLDRVVVQTLGRRSPAVVTVTVAGVVVDRSPEPRLYLQAAALRGVRGDRAGAHRATRSEQLLVLTWAHGDRLLETVLRPRHNRDLEPLVTAATALLADEAAA